MTIKNVPRHNRVSSGKGGKRAHIWKTPFYMNTSRHQAASSTQPSSICRTGKSWWLSSAEHLSWHTPPLLPTYIRRGSSPRPPLSGKLVPMVNQLSVYIFPHATQNCCLCWLIGIILLGIPRWIPSLTSVSKGRMCLCHMKWTRSKPVTAHAESCIA